MMCGTESSSSRTPARIDCGTGRPISSWALDRPSTQATYTSSAPIRIDATPSQTPEPDSWPPSSPPAASSRPTSAAESSITTALTAVSGVSRK